MKTPKAKRKSEDPTAALIRILAEEEPKSFSDLAKQIPSRTGRHINVTCLYRWHHHGIRGVKLEAVRVGGQYLSSVQALTRFLQAIQS